MNKQKKAGLITQHRINNWGSFLQAYASQVFLEKILDCRCEVIDYQYPNDFQFKQGVKKNFSVRSFVAKIAGMFLLTQTSRKVLSLKKARKEYLHLTRPYNHWIDLHEDAPLYDFYVTGSDQTLNPKHTKGDLNFMFSWSKDRQGAYLSLASSMATDAFPIEYEPAYRDAFRKYSLITVREAHSAQYLSRLTGKQVHPIIDPTLLLNREEWLNAFQNTKARKIPYDNYILYYYINHSFHSEPYIWELLTKLQEKTGFRIIALSRLPKVYERNVYYMRDANPKEFVELFANASYIVTSSFHGTAFALNFGKLVYSVVPVNNEKQDSRQVNLLRLLGAESCITPIGTSIDDLNCTYDVNFTNSLLQKEREHVFEYFANI